MRSPPASPSCQMVARSYLGPLSPPQLGLRKIPPAQMESVSLPRTIPPSAAWASDSSWGPPRCDHSIMVTASGCVHNVSTALRQLTPPAPCWDILMLPKAWGEPVVCSPTSLATARRWDRRAFSEVHEKIPSGPKAGQSRSDWGLGSCSTPAG